MVIKGAVGKREGAKDSIDQFQIGPFTSLYEYKICLEKNKK